MAKLWTVNMDFPLSTIITAFDWKKTRIGFCIYWCYIARRVHYRWTNAFTKLCTDAAQSFFLLKNLTILKFWCFFKRFFLEFFSLVFSKTQPELVITGKHVLSVLFRIVWISLQISGGVFDSCLFTFSIIASSCKHVTHSITLFLNVQKMLHVVQNHWTSLYV